MRIFASVKQIEVVAAIIRKAVIEQGATDRSAASERA
jgi:hypothetical protein